MDTERLILNEMDYAEILKYIIEKLRTIGASHIADKIKSLEKESIIESVPSDWAGSWDMEQQTVLFELEGIHASSGKLRKEAVSNYQSRPMKNQEMFHSALQILSAYLQSLPRMLETIQKDMITQGSVPIIWANDRSQEDENPYELIRTISPNEYGEINEILNILKKSEDDLYGK